MKALLCFILTAASFLSPGKKYPPTANRPPHSSINWADTKEWRLYYTQSKRAFAYQIDTLKMFKSVALNQDSMKIFLKAVTEIQTERTPVWMGYYVATCKLPDGTSIKIEISQYGRFFYEEKEKRYYQLTEDVQDSWLSYLTAKWLQLEGAK
ncbi:hypothetical protein Q4E93_13115 [Flavitalea sp. BT771]|uniref:hypothetical protein n=1 Tax=Flavitalea sp. BT771 TaxID=3063329 RepID=UPI0026E3D730|nr:hypothetical protein [Flavitalea sp. BT771]MDO6431538.1 hypothetical protein [Flavitalea sp. BT771]MDV6220446.1 hypothetical protein [Flavitalea sp. BT771]